MLPNHEDLVRAMTQRTSAQADRAGRDRAFRRDIQEQARATGDPARARPVEPERRPCPPPCPPPCPERARGTVG